MGQVVPFIARVRDSGDWSATERARLQDLADRAPVVIGGGTPGQSRLARQRHRIVGKGFGFRCARHCRRRSRALMARPAFRWRWRRCHNGRFRRYRRRNRGITFPEIERILDRRQSRFRRILHLSRGIRHCDRCLASSLSARMLSQGPRQDRRRQLRRSVANPPRHLGTGPLHPPPIHNTS